MALEIKKVFSVTRFNVFNESGFIGQISNGHSHGFTFIQAKDFVFVEAVGVMSNIEYDEIKNKVAELNKEVKG